MTTDPILDSDEARSLVHQLCLMTGQARGTVLAQALREQLRRTRELQARRALPNRADVLARAILANYAGRGIPENHCWGESESALAE
jgi:hypothetical protein